MLICDICGTSFTHKKRYDNHMEKKICHKKQMIKQSLSKHVDKKSYVCQYPECNKEFATISNCTRHIKKYHGDSNLDSYKQGQIQNNTNIDNSSNVYINGDNNNVLIYKPILNNFGQEDYSHIKLNKKSFQTFGLKKMGYCEYVKEVHLNNKQKRNINTHLKNSKNKEILVFKNGEFTIVKGEESDDLMNDLLDQYRDFISMFENNLSKISDKDKTKLEGLLKNIHNNTDKAIKNVYDVFQENKSVTQQTQDLYDVACDIEKKNKKKALNEKALQYIESKSSIIELD